MNKKTYLVTTLLIVLALIVIGSVVAWQRRQEFILQKEAQRFEENLRSEAIAELETIQRYQDYCIKGNEVISEDGRFIKVSGDARTMYEDARKQFTCPSEENDELCEELDPLEWRMVFECERVPGKSFSDGTNGLLIDTQVVGTAGIVKRVVLDASGFVVIYESEKPTAETKPLAVSPLLPAGIWDIVSIAIPTPLKERSIYTASIALDNGDMAYTQADDRPLRNATEDIATASFSVIKD
ncbi:MAG: hypothetical protein A3B31_01295 [Candidatus Komeilibacteria bacterium RIFCSPLOWO2_01_FULL_53_11]|uniref:DUF7282 domain-containing protein n=1 Tax=Candidatus Komeilibacteria bacterium RIFCSPLOWO2_01_FULL_53_11 TaxID=1798552 RepID=A0A1G2BRX4_9BACT|nr:MAG: hypothetical protein A3B31_01295 [Candidatus Komeilibacteria bacterium RIFCSPLOWO2_01_FULL_53_11]